MRVSIIPIDSILADPALQSRAELNEQCVEEYAEAIRLGAHFPPVTVFSDGNQLILSSGFHRVKAHERAGHRTIRAEILTGTRRDAIRHSVGDNVTHGLQRTNMDKRRAVTMMLQDPDWWEWSDNEIGKECGVSHTLVGKVRKEMAASNGCKLSAIRRTANGGTMNTSEIGKGQRKKREIQLADGRIIETSGIGKGREERLLLQVVQSQVDDLSAKLYRTADRSAVDPEVLEVIERKIEAIREKLRMDRKKLKILTAKRLLWIRRQLNMGATGKTGTA